MTLRIVVADDSKALFYDVEHRGQLDHLTTPLQLSGQLSDPLAHLHDRDFKSDRPGRTFDRGPLRPGRRGATAHHSTGGDSSPRKREAMLFAHRIAEALHQAVLEGTVDQLVLIAAPHLLGLLRAALPAAVHKLVIDEIHKDLAHQPESAVRAHLSAELDAGRL